MLLEVMKGGGNGYFDLRGDTFKKRVSGVNETW